MRNQQIVNPDIHFRVLNIISDNPKITQRELSKKLGISLGGVNYCLKALIEVGHIKIKNFSNNPNKSPYLYLLTRQGISEKTTLASDFLKRKILEYKELKSEIENLRIQIAEDQKS